MEPSVLIKKETPCYLSTTGHNDFYYPDYKNGETIFEEDILDAHLKSWICGNNSLKAVLVEANSLRDVVAAPGVKTVFWVGEEHIIRR